ncbi:MAG: folylpolyglutamate synthase/dihydrofolate synthase family protein [Planctomycetota bacterium]
MPSATTTQRSRRSTTAARPVSKGRKPSAKAVDLDLPKPESITNYTTALRWLYAHIDHERLRTVKYDDKTFSLARMKRLLELLDNPQEGLKCVQVAGTKGKGSTCAMLASMLGASGYAVGSYSSPHLVDLRERIAIGGQMISYADCADAFRRIAEVEAKFVATRGISGPPTFFEILTAAALLYFADQAVDLAVLETGLGGRLDSTTAVDPLVVGLTAISLDHTHLLGDTVELIAREKAGVFKPDVPAVSVQQDKAVTKVLKACAEEVGAPLQFTGKDIDFSFRFEANKELGPHSRVCLTTKTSQFEHLAVPLKGEHQAHNCGLALAMIDKLKAHGFDPPEAQVIQGLAKTELPGRMEQVLARPRVFIDGAHNAASIQALIRSLGAHLSYDSLVLVFGCGADKDVQGMLHQVSLGADKVIFTKARQNPRAVEPTDLHRQFTDMTPKMAQVASDLPAALRLASHAVSREDIIVVTGSFYLVGEARKYLADLQRKRASAS